MAEPPIVESQIAFRPETEELRYLPEGPRDLGPGRISWVAIQHGPKSTEGSLNVLDLETGRNLSYPLPRRVGFAHPIDGGSAFVLGLERRIVRFEPATRSLEPIGDEVETDVSGTIINDGESFEEGVVFGAKDVAFRDRKAGLYWLRWRDRRIIRFRSDQVCSNGKVISRRADGSYTVLDIDTPTRRVVRYRLDVERAVLEDEGIALDLSESESYPDGMVSTPDGRGVIIAFYNPNDRPFGEARQFSLDTGRVETIWRVPGSPRVTCPRLVRWRGGTWLILTTAVEGMPEERRDRAPNAGSLFVAPTSYAAESVAR
ncbi:MAG: SMP-30/gluconolactonase/LRE family protein [Planctomycetes bacterium]|nr:SMP-30/gluconolactonase/LRE family protein [Planctomycetota bacterium]